MRRVLVYRGERGPERISVEGNGARCTLTKGASRISADAVRLPDGRLLLRLPGGRQICGRVLTLGDGRVQVVRGAETYTLELADPLRDRLVHADRASAGEAVEDPIRAMMPGRVVEVHVAPGDRVAPGGLLLVLEAMKMQNEIRSPEGGTVVRVEAERGKPVESGALLAVLRRAE